MVHAMTFQLLMAGTLAKGDNLSSPAQLSEQENFRDSVVSVDCGAPPEVEDTLARLTEVVRDLQQREEMSPCQKVTDLLETAHNEIERLSARCWEGLSSSYLPSRPEADAEDLHLNHIPVQRVLGACFEQLNKRQSHSIGSTISTMSSLGGASPMHSRSTMSGVSPKHSVLTLPTFPCASPGKCTMSVMSASDEHPANSWDGPYKHVFGDSPRHTLAGIQLEDVDDFHNHTQQSQLSACGSAVHLSSIQPQLPKMPILGTQQASHRVKLRAVEPVEDQACDDWELEFLRRCKCD
jgi:hypothetical protein